MAITKEQAIEILDKFDFFQGQRAGRELWNGKPFEVQELDISNFSRDVLLLKEYITAADVVPNSTVDKARQDGYQLGKRAVTRDIFEDFRTEIRSRLKTIYELEKEDPDDFYGGQSWAYSAAIAVLEQVIKKYTEGGEQCGGY